MAGSTAIHFKKFAAILLAASVLSGECRIPSGVEATAQRKTVEKKTDHLFQNIAKQLGDMIRDVFTNTYLRNVSELHALDKEFVVVDTTSHKDVTKHFPLMEKHYIEYRTDLRLTRDRDGMFVEGKNHEGEWRKFNKEFRKMVFELINESMEMVEAMPKSKQTRTERQQQQEKVNQHQKNMWKLLENIKKRINTIISHKEYINQKAKTVFTNDKQNENRIPEMEAIEAHVLLVFRRLAKRVRQWAIEAANFYIKKLNKRL